MLHVSVLSLDDAEVYVGEVDIIGDKAVAFDERGRKHQLRLPENNRVYVKAWACAVLGIEPRDVFFCVENEGVTPAM